MAKIISIINLKGGVGKTTTTVQLAECLVSEFHKKVLVIDLDPQTNATIALIGEDKWDRISVEKQTIYNMFHDARYGTSDFNIDRAIVKSASNLNISNLHLLSSSLDLIRIQDDIINTGKAGLDFSQSPNTVLKDAIESVKNNYDYILIDCPPNLGLITLNGIEISDYYFIPTIADKLSTYGLPQIISRIHDYKKRRNVRSNIVSIECLGLLVTKYRSNSGLHKRIKSHLPLQFKEYFSSIKSKPAPVFASYIPEATATAEMVDYHQYPTSFKQKYGTSSSGGQPLHKYVRDMTEEFISYAK